MASFKATIFQKNINLDITKDQKQKILSQKSDFLLLPEFFPLTTKNNSLVNLASNTQKNLDNMIDLSMQYKGIIIGGSFIREENGNYFHSCPIVADGVLIDWFNQKTATGILGPGITTGPADEGFFILNGIRFTILLGDDIEKKEILDYIKKEEIQIVFHLSSNPQNELSLEEDLKKFAAFSAEYQLYIFRVCGTGQLFDRQLKGRSLYSSPAGVNWKVAPSEEETEIVKTINLNF